MTGTPSLEERVAALEETLTHPPPPLTPDEIRCLLRECVTVVKPSETLIVRAPLTWTPTQVSNYARDIGTVSEAMDLPFKTVVLPGEELGVVQAPESDADLIRRIERVWPKLQARNRAAARRFQVRERER